MAVMDSLEIDDSDLDLELEFDVSDASLDVESEAGLSVHTDRPNTVSDSEASLDISLPSDCESSELSLPDVRVGCSDDANASIIVPRSIDGQGQAGLAGAFQWPELLMISLFRSLSAETLQGSLGESLICTGLVFV